MLHQQHDRWHSYFLGILFTVPRERNMLYIGKYDLLIPNRV